MNASTALVFLDPNVPTGRLADPEAVQLRVTDLGASRGDGIFETMLAIDGQVLKEDAHLARLQASARLLDLDIPAQDAWASAISTAVSAARSGAAGQGSPARDVPARDATAHDATEKRSPEEPSPEEPSPEERTTEELMIKLVATRGVEGARPASPTCWVYVAPVPRQTLAARGEPVDVLLLERGFDSQAAERAPWLLLGAKTLSYAVNMAALRYAHARGAQDVIFTSSDGKVLEGPTSTVLVARVRDGKKTLTTPLLESGVLAGTTQGAIFAAAREAGWELGYGPLEPADLFDSDGVWLASSVRLLAPVAHIDGKAIPVNPELTRELTGFLENSRG